MDSIYQKSRDANVEVEAQWLRHFLAEMRGGRLLARYGAHALGIARRVTAGNASSRSLCLRFYVERKHRQGRRLTIPEFIEVTDPSTRETRTFRTDVIESAAVRAQGRPPFSLPPSADKGPLPQPVHGGASCSLKSHPLESGTLGGFVWDTIERCVVLVSNRHVLGSVAADVVSPGVGWAEYSPTLIGSVVRSNLRSPNRSETIDCSIARLGDGWVSFDVPGISPAVFAIQMPSLGLPVRKLGAASSTIKYGEIDDIDYQTWVGFGEGRHWMHDCIRVKPMKDSSPFADQGDSGSLVFASAPLLDGSGIRPVVGLHFAGDPASGTGVACKIQNVFSEMQLEPVHEGALRHFIEWVLDLARHQAAERGKNESVEADVLSFTGPSRRNAWRANEIYEEIAQVHARSATNSLLRAMARHRSHLLTRLVHDRDVQRRAIDALLPLVSLPAGTDMMTRVFDRDDVRNLQFLIDELLRMAIPSVEASLNAIRPAVEESVGRTLADVLSVEVST